MKKKYPQLKDCTVQLTRLEFIDPNFIPDGISLDKRKVALKKNAKREVPSHDFPAMQEMSLDLLGNRNPQECDVKMDPEEICSKSWENLLAEEEIKVEMCEMVSKMSLLANLG